MRNRFLVLFCIGISCSQVLGTPNREPGDELVKRGAFPYMGFIYFMDTSVVDDTGARFMRSAVLIHPEWLVTSALGRSVGFPEKTLLARVGAVSVDFNFTHHEDEDEQEREVIQIVRPYNHSATQWWTTDISLMKTLLPFKMTPSVGIKKISNQRVPETWKTCTILAYTKNSNDNKVLVQKYVDILPPAASERCGTHFSADTMVCGVDNVVDGTMIPFPSNDDSNFCQGNSGGPLIHEGDVMGLQTYINNNCKPPHLYQLFTSWSNFITCSIEDKCQEEHCGNICDVTYKDPPNTDTSKIYKQTPTMNTITLSTLSVIPESATTKEETTNSSPTTIPTSNHTSKPATVTSNLIHTPSSPTSNSTFASSLVPTSTTTRFFTPTSTSTAAHSETDEPAMVTSTISPIPTTIVSSEMTRAYHYTLSPSEERQVLVENEEQPQRIRIAVPMPVHASSARAMCLVQTFVFVLVLLFVID